MSRPEPLRTLPEQGALWLQGLLGTTLGEPIVYRIDVSWLLGVGLLLAVLAAALPRQDEPALLGRRSKAGTAGMDPHQLPDALRLAGALPAADFAAGPAVGKKQQKAGPARGCLPRRGALHQHFNHVDPAARLWPVRRLAAGIIK